MNSPDINDVINERDGWERIGFGIYARRPPPPVDPLPIRFFNVSTESDDEMGVIRESQSGSGDTSS